MHKNNLYEYLLGTPDISLPQPGLSFSLHESGEFTSNLERL